jgi:hypothetical protein
VTRIVLGVLAVLSAMSAHGADTTLSGRYVVNESPDVTLTLSEAGLAVSGSLSDGATVLTLAGQRQGQRISGTIGQGGATLKFNAEVQGRQLSMEIAGSSERLLFRKADAASANSGAGAAQGQRRVAINARLLTAAELAAIEQAYRVRIDEARYWYDNVLGAWGVEGGPTRGFVAPGLPLGGTLQANASAGDTRVFVNGRELHRNDLLVLQQITGTIPPGRYFIYSNGLAGYEGGAPQWNLAQMAAQAQGGSASSWQSRLTGASGISDGSTGAVFLPNGGIVSYGQ